MGKKLVIIFALLWNLAAASCSSGILPEATTTPPAAPTATATATITPTLTPSLTPTVTFTPTPAPISSDNAKMLVPLQVVRADVKKDEGWNWYPELIFSPDFKTYARRTPDRLLILSEAATGKQISSLGGPDTPIGDIAFSRDGRFLATTSLGRIIIWDANTGDKIREITTNFRGGSIAFSSNGKMIGVASGSNYAGTFSLFDAQTGERLQRTRCGGDCDLVVFSPDDRLVALRLFALGGRTSVLLLEVSTGKKINSLVMGIGNLVKGIVFSPDGKTLAVSDEYGTIVLWDATSGQQISSFDHVSRKTSVDGSDELVALAISPDGSVLASGYCSGSIILWDMQSSRPVFVFRSPKTCMQAGYDLTPLISLTFSRDGTLLAANQRNSSSTVWAISNLPVEVASATPIPPTPSLVLLDASGSIPETNAAPRLFKSDDYSLTLGSGTYNIVLNTDENTNRCRLGWQVRPASGVAPNAPAPWYGDSNIPGSFTLSESGTYTISIIRIRRTDHCQAFNYTLRVTKP